MSKYRSAPDPDRTTTPTGIPYIIGNEAAERFSFYGMKGILAVFMVQYLYLMNDVPGRQVTEAAAAEAVHIFNGWVYLTPLLGALISDIFLGKYRTIISLSLVYCMGHACLAFMGLQGEASSWLWAGLALICLGSGGIKPCVSAHVGDQFGKGNAHLLSRMFHWFYFSINLGATISTLLAPWLLKWYGPHIAFGVPGILMAIATIVFWMGRRKFVHVRPSGIRFIGEIAKPEGWKTLLRILPVYVFVAMFWALFDQTQSTWVFQAVDMDRNVLGVEWLPSQVQFINPLLVITFIPLFAYGLYPLINRFWTLTPLRKIGLGLAGMSAAFALVAIVQMAIDAGGRPHIGWQVLAYVVLTASEVMVSIVALEFAYTQSPRSMKSFVMCFYLGSVALGNFFTAGVNHFMQIDSPSTTLEKKLEQATKKGDAVPATIAHAGFDEEMATADDLNMSYKTGEGLQTQVPGQAILEEAMDRIQSWSEANGNRLPSREEGTARIQGLVDPWGKPLRYHLKNSKTCRVSSDGPDGKFKTPWDVGIRLEIEDQAKSKKRSWLGAFRPNTEWLELRKEKIGAKKKGKKAEEDGSFTRTIYAGGGTSLEGASYFWFFTWLMLGTAILFIPYALLYRGRTVLQE